MSKPKILTTERHETLGIRERLANGGWVNMFACPRCGFCIHWEWDKDGNLVGKRRIQDGDRGSAEHHGGRLVTMGETNVA